MMRNALEQILKNWILLQYLRERTSVSLVSIDYWLQVIKASWVRMLMGEKRPKAALIQPETIF